MGLPVTITSFTNIEWLESRAKVNLADDFRGFEAYRGDKLVAAVAFDAWSANSCMAHIAVEDPMVLRHNFLQTGFTFAFKYAGRGVMVALVASNNRKSLKFCKHLGFTELCRIRDGYEKGVDYVLLELRREDCKWLLPLTEKAA